MASGNATGLLGEMDARPGLMIWLVPAAFAILLWCVAWLTRPLIEQVVYGETIAQCDTMLREWFRTRRTPELDRFVFAFTMLGTPTAMVLYALAGLSYLVNRKSWPLVYTWDTVFLGTIALTISLKHLFARARPEGAEVFLTSSTYSLPSTHAVSAVTAFGIIAYVLCTESYRERDQRVIIVLVAFLTIVAMGTSRLYLGVHYLSDVVAGFAVGAAWLSVCLWSLHRFGRSLQPTNQSPSQSR